MDKRFLQAIENIRQRLRDFNVPDSGVSNLVTENGLEKISVDKDIFPVPNLILFVLNGLCSFPCGNRGAKMHWIIPLSYRGVTCAVALEKFGVRFYIPKGNRQIVNVDEIFGKIKKAIETAEKYMLAEIARDEINSANVTIVNLFHKIGNRYYHFREEAKSAYSPIGQENNDENIEGLAKIMNRYCQMRNIGSYNALAMIDAYYSRLEHFLVLALPFSSFDRTKDDLTKFVQQTWSDKMKRIFDIQSPPMRDYYPKLISIKEKYRNTLAHGGFEKKGASFYFHLPGYGAIPASLSGYKNSVHFNLFFIETEDFNEICSLFDEIDEWLAEDGLPLAWMFADSGLNLRFDGEYISKMLAAADQHRFEEWLWEKDTLRT